MRKIIKLALAGLLSVSTLAVAAESSPEALRIGYQKSNISSVLAKNYQMLEKHYPQTKSPGWSSRLARRCWRH